MVRILNANPVGGGQPGILESGATSFEEGGAVTSGDTRLTMVAAGGSAHTKGSYTELIAATAEDAVGIIVTVSRTTTATRYLVDIATGAAASETVVVPDLYTDSDLTIGGVHNTFFFPISVPAGTRISARCQSLTASAQVGVQITMVSNADLQAPSLTDVISLGIDQSNTFDSFVQMNTVAANTKTAWIELEASLSRNITQLYLVMSTSATSGDVEFTYDIGTGAAASETVLIPDQYFVSDGSIDAHTRVIGPIPCKIDAGTRVAFRAQCDTSGTHFAHMACYGV